MSKRAGVRKIETVTWKDGAKIDIKLDMGTGMFHAMLENERGEQVFALEKPNLPTIKEALAVLEKEHVSLDWQPCIAVAPAEEDESYSYRDRDLIHKSAALSFLRFYRAPRKDGEFLYAHFVPTPDPAELKKLEKKKYDDYGERHREAERKLMTETVAGRMGERINYVDLVANDRTVVIPYTASRWAALLEIAKKFDELRGRLLAVCETNLLGLLDKFTPFALGFDTTPSVKSGKKKA